MEKKIAERTNVLTESENKSFVHAVINAVTKGYADNTVLEDILDLVRRKEVSKGVILAAPEALKTYGESLKNSLDFLADQINQLEIVDELTVTKKPIMEKLPEDQPNVVEEEMNKQEEATQAPEESTEKKASLDKFATLKISEDWDKYIYNDKQNKMTGLLKLNFAQNLNKYRTSGNKISLDKNDVEEITTKIYSYFTTEFKNLKANLTPEIFVTDVKFSSLDSGEAEVEYEIKGAF